MHGEPGKPLRDKGVGVSLCSGRDQWSGSVQRPLAQVAVTMVMVANRLLPEGLEQLDPTLHVYRSPADIGTGFYGNSEYFDGHPACRRGSDGDLNELGLLPCLPGALVSGRDVR